MPKQKTIEREVKEKKVLILLKEDFSYNDIVRSVRVSKSTVSQVFKENKEEIINYKKSKQKNKN